MRSALRRFSGTAVPVPFVDRFAYESAQSSRWVSTSLMDTPDVDYGRCSGCHELKHVMAGATVAEHNGYDADGTSVAVVRCTGSGRPPLDAEEEVTPPSSS